MKRMGWKMRKAILWCGPLLFVMPGLSPAQEFPTKPINVVVVYATGGNMDVSTRLLAGKAEKLLGQPFAITNVGGGGGAVGLGSLAKQKPDGYHLGVCSSGSLTFVPQVRTVSYKRDDFIPIMHFLFTPNAIVVRADSPWTTLKELVEYTRKNPGKVTYSTGGAGSPMHIAMEYIGKQEGIRWTHVPYPGAAPALTALLGGHVTAWSGSTECFPHVREGTLRLLAAQGEKRMKAFPDVPTLRELGYDFTTGAFFIVVAPKGTPPSIIRKLDDAFRKSMDDPAFIQALTKMELEITYRNSTDTEKYLEEAYQQLEKRIIEGKIPKELIEQK